MSRKSEVYSWRLSPELKASLEEAARRNGRSISQLLEQIVTARLGEARDGSDAEEQRRLHEKARRFAGSFSGRDPGRAATARLRVRERLRRLRSAR